MNFTGLISQNIIPYFQVRNLLILMDYHCDLVLYYSRRCKTLLPLVPILDSKNPLLTVPRSQVILYGYHAYKKALELASLELASTIYISIDKILILTYSVPKCNTLPPRIQYKIRLYKTKLSPNVLTDVYVKFILIITLDMSIIKQGENLHHR